MEKSWLAIDWKNIDSTRQWIYPAVFNYLIDQPRDIDFIIEDKVFSVHKTILRSVSPFFEKIFKEHEARNDNSFVLLKDVNKDHFSSILDLIYNGHVRINDEEIDVLLKSAKLLEIDFAIRESTEQFESISEQEQHNLEFDHTSDLIAMSEEPDDNELTEDKTVNATTTANDLHEKQILEVTEGGNEEEILEESNVLEEAIIDNWLEDGSIKTQSLIEYVESLMEGINSSEDFSYRDDLSGQIMNSDNKENSEAMLESGNSSLNIVKLKTSDVKAKKRKSRRKSTCSKFKRMSKAKSILSMTSENSNEQANKTMKIEIKEEEVDVNRRCTYCEKVLATVKNRERHQKRCNFRPSNYCRVCSTQFELQEDLHIHIQEHSMKQEIQS